MKAFFVGRDQTLDQLRHAVQARSHLLEGPRGIGKSAVLRHLEIRPPPGWSALHLDLQGVQDESALAERFAKHTTLRRNAVQDWLADALTSWRSADPWSQLESLLVSRSRGPVLVLLDEVQLFLDLTARRDEDRARAALKHLNALQEIEGHAFVLTGSISLRPIAEHLGVTLSPDWSLFRLDPLHPNDGRFVFDHHHSGHCDDNAAELAHDLAGGRPRWLMQLAGHTLGTIGRSTTSEDVLEGARRLLATQPFARSDLKHLERHGKRARLLERALKAAAVEGATKASVLSALQQWVDRGEAERLLRVLQDEFFLDPDACQTLPLQAMALRGAP